MLTVALNWLKKGIAPIPVLYRDKRPAAKVLPVVYEDGEWKHSWKPYQTQLPTENEVRSWFSVHRNLGLICGWQNLVVLDFDDWQAFYDWHPPHTEYAETYSVVTNRGVHLYFYTDETPASMKLPGIDVKASGYVVAPPSIHPSGLHYTELPGRDIMRVKDLACLTGVNSAPVSAKRSTSAQRCPQPWQGGDLITNIKACYEILSAFPNARSTSRGWYVTQCPFHDDKNPSFWIDTNRGLCGCFAGCTPQPLDVIDLKAKLDGVSCEEAIQVMAGEIGWQRGWQ